MEKYYYYDEVIRWIEEDKITIWDLALKLGLSLSVYDSITKLLRKICYNDTSEVNRLNEQLIKNTDEYIKEKVDNKKLDLNTLTELANNGFNVIEIMKMFGFKHYYDYAGRTEKISLKEKGKYASTVKKLKEKIRKNKKSKKVEIFSRQENTGMKANDTTTAFSPNSSLPEETEINNTTTSLENTSSVKGFNSQKIILYSYEYLKYEDFEMELSNYGEEKIILSVTLNEFFNDAGVPQARKIALSNAINDPKINLRVLIAMSNYKKKNAPTNLAYENDLILSQALMLSGYTDREIYIASTSHLTLLNAMILGFGIRVSKRLLIKDFCNIKGEDKLTYFDYKYQTLDLNTLKGKKAYALDSCILIGSMNKGCEESNSTRNKIRNSILSNKDVKKLIFYPVLKEIKSYDIFSSIIYAAKYNPSINLILVTPLQYEYVDISILNLSMYFKNRYNMDITLLTHDFQLYTEALQYNFKSTYCNTEQWLEKFKEDNNISYELLEKKTEVKENEEEDKNIYRTLAFSKVMNNFVLLNNNELVKVMDKDRNVLALMGHKGFKFYQAEIGSLITFRNDPSLYSVRAFEGENNLIAI